MVNTPKLGLRLPIPEELYRIPPQWELVDFGAAANLIDTDMDQVLGILVQPKMFPNLMETIEGSLLLSSGQ